MIRKASRGDEDELLRLQTQPNCRPDSWIDFNIDFVLELDNYLGTFAASFLRLRARCDEKNKSKRRLFLILASADRNVKIFDARPEQLRYNEMLFDISDY